MQDALVEELETLRRTAAAGEADIECDPLLIEAAVFIVVKNGPDEKEYQAGRERCYDDEDPYAREATFVEYNRHWFERLGLAQPVHETLAEYPRVLTRTARRILAPGIRSRDEGADLHAPQNETYGASLPFLVMRVRAESFRHPGHIVGMLRHELMHIDDMLDPTFAYDASIAQFNDSDAVPTAIRDRYRVLWDTYIEGRLHAAGRTPSNVRAKCEYEFAGAFPMLDAALQPLFESLFHGRSWTHPEFLSIARSPRAALIPKP